MLSVIDIDIDFSTYAECVDDGVGNNCQPVKKHYIKLLRPKLEPAMESHIKSIL